MKRDRSNPTPSTSLQSMRNSAIAGYSSGFVGVVVGHPLDSLKVWAQTASSGRNKHFATSQTVGNSSANNAATSSMFSRDAGISRPSSRSMSTVARKSPLPTAACTLEASRFLRTVRAVYSGASVPLFTVGFVQSINFTTYDTMRRYLHQCEHPWAPKSDYLYHDSLSNVAIAGFIAGCGLAFATSPLILIKTNQQITGNGFREAFRETMLPHGRLNLTGVFTGFAPHIASETMGRALYYTIYEYIKRSVAASKVEKGVSPSVSLTERMGAAALAGISCWSVIFPLDALRNRLYSQVGSGKKISTWNTAMLMYNEAALYRGFSLTILRAGPVAAAVLPVYDLVLERLST